MNTFEKRGEGFERKSELWALPRTSADRADPCGSQLVTAKWREVPAPMFLKALMREGSP
jgi:hypothetical protein